VTTEYDDDLDEQDEQTTEETVPNWRRNLERKAKKEADRADAAEQRAASAERNLAFLQAGVDTSDPKTKYFAKGYDGDLTKEAVTAAAVEAGLVDAPADTADQVPAAEKEAWGRAGQVAAGGESVGSHGFPEAIQNAKERKDFQSVIALKQQEAAAAVRT
jgi:hypothetical protein